MPYLYFLVLNPPIDRLVTLSFSVILILPISSLFLLFIFQSDKIHPCTDSQPSRDTVPTRPLISSPFLYLLAPPFLRTPFLVSMCVPVPFHTYLRYPPRSLLVSRSNLPKHSYDILLLSALSLLPRHLPQHHFSLVRVLSSHVFLYMRCFPSLALRCSWLLFCVACQPP